MLELDLTWLNAARDKTWLIGVSGGRDSVALLHACHEAGVNKLTIAHINHELRGKESDDDEEFVRYLAVKYDLPIEVKRADVTGAATTQKKSLELAAREARHQFFAELCRSGNFAGVLLAHHADDQTETILFNLLRGSAGLKGMLKVQPLAQYGITLYRPLLDVPRSEIDAYLSRHQLCYREDSSNAEDFATRNRLRSEALPLLEDIMGRNISPAINRAFQVYQNLEHAVEASYHYNELLDPEGRIFLPSLEPQPKAIQQQVLHRYLTDNQVSQISHELIESALTLLDKSQPAKLNLPGGKFLRRRQQRLFIEAP